MDLDFRGANPSRALSHAGHISSAWFGAWFGAAQLGPNGRHECLGLADKPTCIGEMDSVVAVVGDAPKGFGTLEQSPRFFGHQLKALHESVAEGVERAGARLVSIVSGGKQCRSDGTEYGVVGAVACAVGIAALK